MQSIVELWLGLSSPHTHFYDEESVSTEENTKCKKHLRMDAAPWTGRDWMDRWDWTSPGGMRYTAPYGAKKYSISVHHQSHVTLEGEGCLSEGLNVC